MAKEKVNTYQEPRGWLRAEWTPAEVRTVWAIAQQGDMRPVASPEAPGRCSPSP